MASEYMVLVQNGTIGDVLLTLELAPTTCLQAAVEERLQELLPFKLIHDGRVYEAPSNLLEFGLPHDSCVSLVRMPPRKDFSPSAFLNLDGNGYHCHDSYLNRIPCHDQGTFAVAFQRSFRGPSWREYRSAFRQAASGQPFADQPRVKEVVVSTVSNLSVSSGNASVDTRGTFTCSFSQRTRLLALGAAGIQYTWEQDIENQRTLIRKCGPSPDLSVWPVVYSCAELWQFEDCIFDDLRIYMLAAECQSETELARSTYLFEFHVDPDGALIEERRVKQTFAPHESLEIVWGSRMVKRFLSLDRTGGAVWFQSLAGIHVAPLDTLEAKQSLSWNELSSALPKREDVELHTQVLMDPLTRDIYFFLDMSLTHVRETSTSQDERESDTERPTCEVYCLFPDQAFHSSRPSEVTYTELPGQLVCTPDFGIDGFSDSFCIEAVHFAIESREVLVLDAHAELWRMKI
eukprot:TRINITY_DN28779_c0_g1_i1.p1 TRINITY_DN28779_c0_g1~~TRINITY_DN28779_c0_g1_i1.p1  ORF type:complete len:461 (+),score=36.19 TRINITY_DN28779_c0_g1_i1:61-1443(+)